MYKNHYILGIIPARGGSKGIPRKNLALLDGRPLISHSITAAKRSKFLDAVVVSSDSDEILAVAAGDGAECIRRPDSLGRDTSPMEGALLHAIREVNRRGFVPDFVALLQPTSPFRTTETIDRAIKEFIDAPGFDALASLVRITPKLGRIVRGRYVPVTAMGKQRQELPEWYKECGTIFVFKAKRILAGKPLFGKRILPLAIEHEREALDIDTPADLALADYFLTHEL